MSGERRASPDWRLRPEAADDRQAIGRLHRAAFGGPTEAALVDALRAAGQASVSLVAVDAARLLGHILFSPVSIEAPAGKVFSAVGLAPMAVLPALQRCGIGSSLVEAGLAACRAAGHRRVVVLGHADYYPRFGFEPAGRHGVRSTYDVPDEVFMIRALVDGGLDGVHGIARYRREFDQV